MSKEFDRLNKKFNIPMSVPEEETTDIVNVDDVIDGEIVEVNKNNLSIKERDFKKSRKQLKKLVDTSDDAITNILDHLKDYPSSRGFEVLGQLLKHSSEISEKLAKIHEINDNKNDVNSNNKVNVTNNTVFYGTTNDLINELKNKGLLKDNK